MRAPAARSTCRVSMKTESERKAGTRFWEAFHADPHDLLARCRLPRREVVAQGAAIWRNFAAFLQRSRRLKEDRGGSFDFAAPGLTSRRTVLVRGA